MGERSAARKPPGNGKGDPPRDTGEASSADKQRPTTPTGREQAAVDEPLAAGPGPGGGTQWIEPITDWIGRHPGMCLGAAIAMGVMIGWLVKRK